MKPRFTIEFWPHGWLVCGAVGQPAVPLTALSECEKLFPKTAIMDMGIPHHFHACGRREVVMCVASEKEALIWRTDIKLAISSLPPQERWWKGLDVGTSSAALFSVFCERQFKFHAEEMGQRNVPHDADDFGRCFRLIELFPEWRAQLNRVAEAYPETKWPAIVARWTEIANSPASEATKILSSL